MSIETRLEEFKSAGGRIREIDPHSEVELDLVTGRMRQTLIDVMGEEKGTALYTLDWLRARLLWHLDPKQTTGKVFISFDRAEHITGHAIARIEPGENGKAFGFFSTLFVEAESRKRGVATALMTAVETWFVELRLPRMIYNTAVDNSKLIRLFHEFGFRETLADSRMVQLTKVLPGRG